MACGEVYRELAAEVSVYPGLSCVPATISRFSNDCLRGQLNANRRECDIKHLMELSLMLYVPDGADRDRLNVRPVH